MKYLAVLAVTTGLAMSPMSADAQLFYIGLRGGAASPAGEFAKAEARTDESVLAGAKTGFGYGLDAGINLGPVGVYAGFDKMNFDCVEATCPEDSKYKLQGVSAGVRLSIPLFPLVKPWVKGGVTFNELEAEYGSTSSFSGFKTERTPGYEIGAGVDIPFAGFFSITPQLRYVGQKLDYKIPGVSTGAESSSAANYFAFDLGLRLRSPL